MSEISQAPLLLSITFALVSSIAALELPYEVLDSIVELSDTDQDFAELTSVNVSDDLGPTRTIYRLDLEQDFVAYYEIDIGSSYVVFSSGKKTGDYREVESGPDPRPTDVLIQQAQGNGQQCDKFYRLSPMGLTVCKNANGTVVAANYNWTSSTHEIKDWRKLDQMVTQSLNDFKQQWQERSLQRRSRSDWATTDVVPRGGEKEINGGINEEAIFPGSIMKLALGERFRSVNVYIRNIGNLRMRPSSTSEWQQRLCGVLVNVCMPERSTEVNPVAIMETANHLSYMKLEVRGNRTLVGNVLQWREIGFVVEIRGRKNKVIKKHFAINLQSKRSRRSLTTVSIPAESDDFPDYNQHKCCGCLSGCSPVSWAQVFGYFDRRARYIPHFFSPNIYGDRSIVAPKTLTDDVKRFIEDIRDEIKTICVNGQGSTKLSKMHYIATWFRERQGSRSRVASHLESRKRRAARRNGANVQRGGSSWIASKAVYYLGYGYPVVLSITLEGGSGHSVVATSYRRWSKDVRLCGIRKTGWWLGRKTKKHCYWKTTYSDYEFYLHYGWGGRNNKWQEVGLKGAYCAYLNKSS